jgi:hypothetical protein
MSGVAFVGGPFGYVGAGPHYTAAGARLHGTNMGNAAAGKVVVSFENVAVSQAETNSGTIAYNYTVYRSTNVGTVAVPLTFTAGTTNAADYPGGVLPSGLTANFTAGSNVATFTQNVVGDTTVETDEAATFTLAPTGAYVVGARPTATLSILNDDSAGAGTNLMASGRVQAANTWSLTGVSVTADAAANPVSGITNVDRVTSDTATSQHFVNPGTTGSGTLTTGTSYSVAQDMKYESGLPYVQILHNGSNLQYVNFDIQAGTVTASGTGILSASITSLGGGWFRCAYAFVESGAGARAIYSGVTIPTGTQDQNLPTFAGTAGSYLVCNQQCVAGTVANAF